MPKADYGRDLFKQVQELMLKCDNLSHEVKTIEKRTEKKFKKQLKEQKEFFTQKIESLEKENEQLKDKNQKLTNEVDRLKKQLNNNSNNSSKPPSSDIKKNIPNNREKTNKKSGGQKGHKGYHLSKKIVEEKIEKGEFEREIINVGKVTEEYKSKYILDIKVKVIAKEYRFYKDENGKYNIPKEFQTDVQYGEELKTMCTVLNTEGIVALDRLANFVSCISHGAIDISKGSIVNFMNELNRKSEYIIERIKEKLLNKEKMHTDGTSGRCENKNVCIRTHSTEDLTLFVPTYGKGKKHIEETGILNKFMGLLIHDHETVMYNYGTEHAECNVHILRYLKGCNENTKNKWAIKMRSLLSGLNEYRKKLKEKGEEKIEKEKIEEYSKRYDELIEEGHKENKKIKSKYIRQDEQKLLNRLKKYKENHLKFLYDFRVPFDNNLAERDLRNFKIKLKVSGRFNSMEGMKVYSNIRSIIVTFKKQGKNFYEAINKIYKNIPVSI